LTLTSCTPGTFLSARSTRPTQEAQVMPSMSMLSVCTGGAGVFMEEMDWTTMLGLYTRSGR